MKTYRQFVVETFESPLPVRWERRSNERIMAYFEVDAELKYLIEFVKLSESLSTNLHARAGNLPNRYYGNDWSVLFSLRDHQEYNGVKSGDHNITGTGHANRIFATVVSAINEFMRMENPDALIATAEEPSRIKLYKRMMPILAQQHSGYTGQEMGRGYFKLERQPRK